MYNCCQHASTGTLDNIYLIFETISPQHPGCYNTAKKKWGKKDLQDSQGLISVDRSSKATQPLTIPGPIQVVYKGSSPRNRQV